MRAVVVSVVAVLLLSCVLPLAAQARRGPQIFRSGLHASTVWQVEPSMGLDALCLFDTLSGDHFYRTWYQADYQRFWPRLTVQEQAAFSEVKYLLKDQQGGIVAGTLTLYFSASEMDPQSMSLDGLIAAAGHPAAMYAAMRGSGYYDPGEAARFEQARPAILTGLLALRRIGFPDYWQRQVQPRILARAADVTPLLQRYNIIPEIETRLGHTLPDNTVTIYLLEYSQPHGIRITGQRLITHYSYPWDYTLRNATHELMHPPFDRADPAVARAEERIGNEPLLHYVIHNHDRSFGYNNEFGYSEEDCVQALEQVIEEKLGVAQRARPYWDDQDGGMHVLAIAIYAALSHDLQAGPVPPFHQWFVANVNAGRFEGANLTAAVDSVMGSGWLQRKWGARLGGRNSVNER